MADPNIPESSEESKARHTPGPWMPKLDETYAVVDETGVRVAITTFLRKAGRRPADEVAANAHLIAASPLLLAELRAARELVIKWCHTQGSISHCMPGGALYDQYVLPIDTAIAKAEGTDD